jgi:hypothetical protein
MLGDHRQEIYRGRPGALRRCGVTTDEKEVRLRLRHSVQQLVQVGPVTHHSRRHVHSNAVAKRSQAPCNRNALVRSMAWAARDGEPLGPGELLSQLDAPFERKNLELRELLPGTM